MPPVSPICLDGITRALALEPFKGLVHSPLIDPQPVCPAFDDYQFSWLSGRLMQSIGVRDRDDLVRVSVKQQYRAGRDSTDVVFGRDPLEPTGPRLLVLWESCVTYDADASPFGKEVDASA